MMTFKQKFGLMIILTILLSGCTSTKNLESEGVKDLQYQELKELVSTKSYSVELDVAYPLLTNAVLQVNNALFRNTGNTAGRIQLTGSSNYININGDIAEGNLSYFGEVQMAGSLNPRDNGIRFNDVVIDYEASENAKKRYVAVNFNVKGKREAISVFMRLYSNNRASIVVNSSKRTSIRYDGTIKLLEPKIADNN